MTETETRIVRLFKTLPPSEQRALVEHLAETTENSSLYDRLSPEQLAQLDEGIAQAERGETVPAARVFERIANLTKSDFWPGLKADDGACFTARKLGLDTRIAC